MFNTALYYPTIDITNDNWLKSAVLFWNRIETIVPQGIEHPYHRRTTQFLADEGILFPHMVDPFCKEVAGLQEDIERFCNTRAGRMAFVRRGGNNNKRLTVWDGLSTSRCYNQFGGFYVHASKLPYITRARINDLINTDGFVEVNEQFMKYYMTLLANRICQQNNMALLTDRVYMNDLSNKTLIEGLSRPHGEQEDEQRTGLMYKVVMEGIDLDPATPIERIIHFKRDHQEELKDFQNEMSRLISFDKEGMTLDDIEKEVRNIYNNSIIPSVNNLKKALQGARMDWRNDLTTYTMTGIASSLFTLNNPVNIIPIATGSLIGISMSTVRYLRKLNQREDQNPYTYLLKIENHLRNRGFHLAGHRNQ